MILRKLSATFIAIAISGYAFASPQIYKCQDENLNVLGYITTGFNPIHFSSAKFDLQGERYDYDSSSTREYRTSLIRLKSNKYLLEPEIHIDDSLSSTAPLTVRVKSDQGYTLGVMTCPNFRTGEFTIQEYLAF